jgi:hypothetical protein
MKNSLIIFLFLLCPVVSHGQHDYFSTDSLTFVGVTLIRGWNRDNAQTCKVKIGGKIKEYSPYEVSEYGYDRGRSYVSREIQIGSSTKRVFLEQLHDGNINLYFYREKGLRTFFIETDSASIVEMPKKNIANQHFTELLTTLIDDCPEVSDLRKLVCYNRNSLSRFFERYERCEFEPLARVRYGLIIGYEFSRLTPSQQSELSTHFDYYYNRGFSAGAFIDYPILYKGFSAYSGIMYSQHGHSYYKYIDNKDIDLIANLSTINVPLLIRYARPSNKLRPLVNAGIFGAYHVKNEIFHYEAIFENNTIEIIESESGSLINDINMGYNIGAGIEYKLNYKNSLSLEIRYSNQFGILDSPLYRTSGFNLLTAINF